MPLGGNDRSRGPRAFSEADASRKLMRGGDRPVGARPVRHGTAIRSHQPQVMDVEPVSLCPEFTSADPPDQAPIPRPDGSFEGCASCGDLDAGAAPINSPPSEPNPTGHTMLRDRRIHMRHAIWPLVLLATSAPSFAQPARDVPPSPSVPAVFTFFRHRSLPSPVLQTGSVSYDFRRKTARGEGNPCSSWILSLPRKARTKGSPRVGSLPAKAGFLDQEKRASRRGSD